MQEKNTTIIEVNGVKLEVDLRQARRVDLLTVGSRVKCLIKKYDSHETYPGIVVGFEPFEKLPTIVVAYLETNYSSAGLRFKTFNSETKDFEIVADLDNNSLEIDKANVLRMFDKEIQEKEISLEDIKRKKQFFLDKFGDFFQDEKFLRSQA